MFDFYKNYFEVNLKYMMFNRKLPAVFVSCVYILVILKIDNLSNKTLDKFNNSYVIL